MTSAPSCSEYTLCCDAPDRTNISQLGLTAVDQQREHEPAGSPEGIDEISYATAGVHFYLRTVAGRLGGQVRAHGSKADHADSHGLDTLPGRNMTPVQPDGRHGESGAGGRGRGMTRAAPAGGGARW